MTGKIFLVGIGPGKREHMTFKAVNTLKNADVVIVCKDYLNLINDLILDKEIIAEDIAPIKRAEIAAKMALEGKTVAVACIGDPTIYAMANIFFQYLEKNKLTIPIEVVPGITAATAASAILGAPLGTDFTVISLGEKNVPWETIKRRLEYASKADFVIVIYNPISKVEKGRMEKTVEVLRRYKRANTPVGLVKSATLPNEEVQITTLDKMLNYEIDNLTTIIIGNSESVAFKNRLITPRKYDLGY